MRLPQGSMVERTFYALGYLLEEAESRLGSAAPRFRADEGHEPLVEADPVADRPRHGDILEDAVNAAGTVAGSAAVSWIVARLMRPKPVRWPLVVLAGTAATALADFVDSLDDDERPGFPPTIEDLPRYAAGVATAAAYAAILYPRLPGSPLTRALAFGALDGMLEDGGVIGLLRRVAPEADVPMQSLAGLRPERRSPLAALAFGLGLALYRGKD